jgi:hypothetical protein
VFVDCGATTTVRSPQCEVDRSEWRDGVVLIDTIPQRNPLQFNPNGAKEDRSEAEGVFLAEWIERSG